MNKAKKNRSVIIYVKQSLIDLSKTPIPNKSTETQRLICYTLSNVIISSYCLLVQKSVEMKILKK